MRKIAFWTAYLAMAAACSAGAAEILLRLRRSAGPRIAAHAHERLRPQWAAGRAPDAFSCPFPVFTDRGPLDEARLARVYEASRYPSGAIWEGSDFLQSPGRAALTRFRIETNAMGWRDRERECRKPSDAFRVIALGDYMTFGQGVAAEEAYPQRLEAYLRARHPGRRIEVWNAGRQAATAIVGLAALERQLWACRPDALIVAYGFVDHAAVEDDLMPITFHVPSLWRKAGLLRRLLLASSRGASRSALFEHLLNVSLRPQIKRNIEAWNEVMDALLASADRRGVPVFLLDRGGGLGITGEHFELAARRHPGSRVLHVDRIYAAAPPTEEQKRQFMEGPHWTEELDFPLPDGEYASYRVDVFHPNRWGHDAIAKALADALEDEIDHRKKGRASR